MSTMSSNLKVKVDERLDIARLVDQHKNVLFSSDLSEEQKTEAWSRILAECTSRGHHWVKGKDVTYLKKSKWPGIKRDAIEHYQADMKSDISHRKKLTEADAIVLKAISFDTENSGASGEKEVSTPAKEADCRSFENGRFKADVTQPVTVEVKAGQPLDLMACGMQINHEMGKFDNGLLVNLFSKNDQEPMRAQPPLTDQHRYAKRHRVDDDDGPIDHDLMAALGFGKSRQKRVESREQDASVPTITVKGELSESVTTIGEYLRSVATVAPAAQKLIVSDAEAEGKSVFNEVAATQKYICSEVPSQSPPIMDKRQPSLSEHPKIPATPSLLQKVTNISSSASVASPKECGRDMKALQRKAFEAQIAREEAMAKYYELKAKKLELEIAQLQQSKREFGSQT